MCARAHACEREREREREREQKDTYTQTHPHLLGLRKQVERTNGGTIKLHVPFEREVPEFELAVEALVCEQVEVLLSES